MRDFMKNETEEAACVIPQPSKGKMKQKEMPSRDGAETWLPQFPCLETWISCLSHLRSLMCKVLPMKNGNSHINLVFPQEC